MSTKKEKTSVVVSACELFQLFSDSVIDSSCKKKKYTIVKYKHFVEKNIYIINPFKSYFTISRAILVEIKRVSLQH